MILSLIFTNLFNQKLYFLINLAVFISCWVCMYIMKKHIFLYCFMHKSWKNHKIPFWITKRGQNSKIIWLFESLEVDYITILPLLFISIHFGRICSQKRIFLYCFMHKSWKTTKYIFWLQKVVKSWIWWHFQIRDQKLVYISFLLFLENERFIPLVGGG